MLQNNLFMSEQKKTINFARARTVITFEGAGNVDTHVAGNTQYRSRQLWSEIHWERAGAGLRKYSQAGLYCGPLINMNLILKCHLQRCHKCSDKHGGRTCTHIHKLAHTQTHNIFLFSNTAPAKYRI